jgi:hypothetical protein
MEIITMATQFSQLWQRRFRLFFPIHGATVTPSNALNDELSSLELQFLQSSKRLQRMLIGLILSAILAVIIAAIALFFVLRNPLLGASVKAPSTPIDASPKRLRAHVKALTTTSHGHRHAGNVPALHQAAQYIKQQWKILGLKITKQTYKASGNTYQNLITFLGPERAPRIILGAHYDVCGEQPGADDNASAVAGLIELSRLLKPHDKKLKYRVEFVAYTLEEPPHFRTQWMGSAVHAASLKKANVDVKMMLSLEMIGYFSNAPNSQKFPLDALALLYPTTGNFIAVIGNLSKSGRSIVQHMKAHMRAASPLSVQSMNAPASVPGIDFSDHLNYWAQGYPAAMITDTSFYRNHNYHKITDTIDTLDFDKMADVVRGVYWAVLQFP